MTKSKHTPGPWQVSPSLGIWTKEKLSLFIGDRRPSLSKEEAQANANLVSAAPDLLKNLEQALRFIEVRENYKGAMTANEVEAAIKNNNTTLTEIGANSCNTLASFSFEKTRAAIAKAKGAT